MPDESNHILDLICGYLMGQLNAAQQQELDHWIHSSYHNRMLFDQLTDPQIITKDLQQMGGIDGQPVWNRLREEIPGLPVQFKDTDPDHQTTIETTSRPHSIGSRYRWWAAAILLAILTGVALWVFRSDKVRHYPGENRKDSVHLTIQPPLIDSTKTNLIMENGTVIILTGRQGDIPWQELGTHITSTDSSIEYNRAGAFSSPLTAVHYNTIMTPPGKAYLIHLVDGSNAWLSAGSTLRFPVPFAGDERRVELTGEAFFTVKPVKGQPFLVLAKETISLVRGTSFNVRAYPTEEGVRTTVEKGKVTVKDKKNSVEVSTGEEARLTTANGWKVSKLSNAGNAGSWRLGVLEFDRTPLQEVLTPVAEWYAYKIDGQPGASSNERMTGRLNITDPITNVVKAIEKNFMVRIEVDMANKILRIY